MVGIFRRPAVATPLVENTHLSTTGVLPSATLPASTPAFTSLCSAESTQVGKYFSWSTLAPVQATALYQSTSTLALAFFTEGRRCISATELFSVSPRVR